MNLRRLAALLLCLPALAQAGSALVATEHVRAELVAHAPEGVLPGKPLRLGLLLRHQPGWHTYWKNPGDSGLPTTLAWQLPAGVQAGEIEWPTPKPLPIGPLVNYGYEGDLLLPVPLTIPAGFAQSGLEVKLRADWLVCKEICIPESGDFMLTVPAQAATAGHADAFAAAAARQPLRSGAIAAARVDGTVLAIEARGLPPEARGRSLQFLAETAGVIDPAARIEQRWDGERWIARVPLSAQRSESPTLMQAVLVEPGAARGLQLRVDIAGPWPSGPAPAPGVPQTADATLAPAGGAAFALALGLALIGGMLLNLLPCVFPVLSLKLLGFAQPGLDRRSLAAGGLAYTIGVVASFVGLAGLLLALRAGGAQLGWGFQLQSPLFVSALAVLFTLIGLNLAGLFELGSVLPSGLASLRARHPLADHALTGVLAVAVASPCTGPFMGVALGAALLLPAGQALAVFAALGLGMALPFLAASLATGLAARLPRPGAWMLRFKVVMAFPMFATVVWLVWVLGQQTGIDGAAGLLAVLVAVGFTAWVFGLQGLGRRARAGWLVTAAMLLAATVGWAWLGIAEPPAGTAAVAPSTSPAGARWQPWSPEAVARAGAEGRPVFVDFTAAWCVTCQFNKRSALADAAVLADFDARRVLLLRADWTRRDAAITRALAGLGRSGVPVYAFYAPGERSPRLLPEILTADRVRGTLAGL